GFNFEQPLFDFGHFVLEELTNELRRRARKNDLLTTRGMIDSGHPSTDAVTYADVFTRYHFGTGQTTFNLARVDDRIAFIHALDHPGNDGFTALQEVVQHLLTLGVTNFLQNRLLGGLRTDTTEFLGF